MKLRMEDLKEKPQKTVVQPKPKKKRKPIKAGKGLGYVAIVAAILLAILIIAIRVGLAYHNSGSGNIVAEAKTLSEDKVEETIVILETTETVSADEIKTPNTGGSGDASGIENWHFYNLDLQEDGQILNDYDFGPNPILDNISADKIKEIVKGKKLSDTVKVKEIIEMLDAEELKEEQIRRMHDDTKLGAADMAWMDSILGTRFLGTFYSVAEEQWDVAMNDAADAWIEDAEAYDKALDTFERKLNHANKVELRYVNSGLTDQMYMEPDGKNPGAPDIVVMETTSHEGYFIVYTYIIKETKTLEVMYRVDCGFQPTNVAKVMNITPKKNPNKPTPKKVTNNNPTPPAASQPPVVTTPAPVIVTDESSSSSHHHHHSSDGGGNVSPIPVQQDPSTPTPVPVDPINPIPTPPKDPTDGSNSDPNDEPGVDKNTNNPANPNFSTEDQETNSNHQTPEQTDQAVEDNHWANETGREGGDSNEPSTPPPSEETHEDNNGGDIDEPTENSESSVDHDSPGDHWDGPPD